MRRNLLLLVLACGFGSLASADIIQLDKNCGGDCDNVLFKTQQTGNPVFGFFNNDDTKEVEFSSLDGSLLITGAAGQATIEGDDLDDLVIELNGFTAEFFELNLDGAGGGPDPDSTLSITFNILGGPNPTETFSNLSLDAAGENRLTFQAVAGQEITGATLLIDPALEAVIQVRLGITEDGGEEPPEVPEPATLALMGAGLVGIGVMKRRARKV